MLAKLIQFVKTYQSDIILVIGVILISLLSFAVGYIVAKQGEKEPIRIEKGVEENSFLLTFAPPAAELDWTMRTLFSSSPSPRCVGLGV